MYFIARRYDTAELARFRIEAGRIFAVESVKSLPPKAIKAGEPKAPPWILPGLVDLQVNGYGGRDFSSPRLTIDDVAAVTAVEVSQGVTRYLPTVTTGPHDVLRHALATIAAACETRAEVARQVIGIHLEGPYISPEEGARGAHPAAHCRRPDWDEFQRLQEAAGGRIRLVTLAPELDGAAAFIRRLTDSRVIVSLGHTAADGHGIRAAVDSGARLSTHLGNGAHRMLRRHPNYIWDQLAEDRLTATLIADGHHLPPEVLKTFVRAKTPERVILVSDVSCMAGLPPGNYSTQLCDLEILADGRLVLAGQDQLLAGAARPLLDGVANLVRSAGVTLRDAVDMASRRPAELLGLESHTLAAGEPADFILVRGLEGEPRPTLVTVEELALAR